MKVAASCFALIWTILIARNLPKADAGFIFSFISIYTIASTLARQGSDSTILRYTATEGMKDHRFFRAVAITIGCVAVVTSIGAFFFMPAPDWNIQTPPVVLSICLLVAVIAGTLCVHFSFVIRGLGKSQLSVWLQSGAIPFTAVVMIGFAVLAGVHLNSIFVIEIYVAATIIGLSQALFVLVPSLRGKSVDSGETISNFLKESRPLFLLSIMQLMNQWVPILLTGKLDGLEAAAEFQVATRLSLLANFILFGITTVAAPRMAKAWHCGEIDRLRSVFRQSMLLSASLGAFVIVPLFIFPGFFLGFFGNYQSGVVLLQILLLGQCVGILMGPVINLLTMTKNQSALYAPAIISGLLVGVTGFFCGKIWGSVGVASAVAVAVATQNIMAFFSVRRRIGIDIFG